MNYFKQDLYKTKKKYKKIIKKCQNKIKIIKKKIKPYILKLQKYTSKIKDYNYFILLIVTYILVKPLLSDSYPLGHDFDYHASNIYVTIKSILNLSLSKIVPIIANDFGYGAGIFYPKLPHIFAGIIGVFVKNPIISLKVVYVLIIILSFIFMYNLLNKIFKDKTLSLLGTSLYITAPYFMNDIYARDALNESFLFIFIPIAFTGLIELLNKNYKNFYIYFIIGYVGLINSHLVMSIYLTIIFCIFLLINYKEIFTKENLKKLITSSIFILIFTLPSLIMLLEHKMLDIYTVFDSETMWAVSDHVKDYGLNIADYIKERYKCGDMYVFTNKVTLFFSFLGLIYLFKSEKIKQKKSLSISILICLIISILLSSKYFPYQYIPSILLSIQFAFRNVLFIVFFASIFVCYGLKLIKEKYRKIIVIIAIIISCSIITDFTKKAIFIEHRNLDILYSQGMGVQKEYLPKVTNDNIKYFKKRDNSVKILNDSKTEIKTIKDETPYLEFKINNVKEKTILELPRLYYLGYDIKLNDKKIDYEMNDKGFITINVKESGTVTINYKGTTLYKITLLLRYITIIGLIIYFIKRK